MNKKAGSRQILSASCFKERVTLLAVFLLVTLVLIVLLAFILVVLVILVTLILVVLTVVLHEGTSFQLVEYRKYSCPACGKYTENIVKNNVDKSKDGCYTNQAKQRRLIASASPPATGKEVNTRYDSALSLGVGCCCADAGLGIRVL